MMCVLNLTLILSFLNKLQINSNTFALQNYIDFLNLKNMLKIFIQNLSLIIK